MQEECMLNLLPELSSGWIVLDVLSQPLVLQEIATLLRILFSVASPAWGHYLYR